MLKYVDTLITFQEVPDEITLCVNFSNCPNKCVNCHSSYLQNNIGKQFTYKVLEGFLKSNKGISCICFMGGDNDHKSINRYAKRVKDKYSNIKVAWYSGNHYISQIIDIGNFDYIKVGPYIEDLGGLTSKTTNQRFYVVEKGKLKDITYKFQ